MIPRLPSFSTYSRSWCVVLFFILVLFLDTIECYQDVSSDSWSSLAYEWGLLGRYPQYSYKTSSFHPPRMNTVRWDDQCAHGYTLLSLRGTMVDPKPAGIMIDGQGDLVWIDESFGYVMNLKVQEYKGEQYLTFWSGSFGEGFGLGTYYMLDSHYEIYKQFSTAGTKENDFHEYTITADDTALLTSYDIVATDLSSLGVPGQGWIYDSVFREIDIETDNTVFEWHASDHFAISDTFYPIGSAGKSPDHPFDFFHINSVDKNAEGNYVISSRFMHSIACISASTGEILWILGGRNNDFEDLSDGSATDFAWQHHASVQPNNQISIFDNANYKKWYQDLWNWDQSEISRGMLVSLDIANKTVELAQEYINPTLRGSPQQGSMQVLESGNVLVGWGYHGAFTEYAADGSVLCDTHINPSITFPFGFVHSYRAFRTQDWVGRPNTIPDIYMNPSEGEVFVSWLGATEVTAWVLQTAASDTDSELIYTNQIREPKTGFETAMSLPEGSYEYFRIAAVNSRGDILAVSKTITRASGTTGVPGTSRFLIFIGVCLGICFVMCLFFQRRVRTVIKLAKQKLEKSNLVVKLQAVRRSSTAKYAVEEEERLVGG